MPTHRFEPRPVRTLAFTLVASAALAAIATYSRAADSADPPTTWQGLELRANKTIDTLYVRPGASLKAYQRVTFDPIEVEFKKQWTSDPRKVPNSERERIRKELSAFALEVFQNELMEKGNYKVVNEQGPDVLRVRVGLVNLYITAPDIPTASRTTNYVLSSGEMTLAAELRDSDSGEILAVAVDRRVARETGMMQWSSGVTNKADARQILQVWASQLRKALDASRGS